MITADIGISVKPLPETRRSWRAPLMIFATATRVRHAKIAATKCGDSAWSQDSDGDGEQYIQDRYEEGKGD